MRIILLLCSLLSSLSTTVWAGTPGEIEVGAYLRDEPLHGFDGKTTRYAEYRGKPLIINVWASYCGPCLAEMGSLERLSQLYEGKAFKVIGISIDDNRQAAVNFIRRSKVTFENYLDRKLLQENMLGANRIPLTILVDAQGKVLHKALGAYEWDSTANIEGVKQIFELKHSPEPGNRSYITPTPGQKRIK